MEAFRCVAAAQSGPPADPAQCWESQRWTHDHQNTFNQGQELRKDYSYRVFYFSFISIFNVSGLFMQKKVDPHNIRQGVIMLWLVYIIYI